MYNLRKTQCFHCLAYNQMKKIIINLINQTKIETTLKKFSKSFQKK